MKVTVLGGSSASTPALFRCLASRTELPPMEMWLVGRSPEHLGAVSRAAGIFVHEAPIVIRLCSFGAHELPAALEGADVVLVQVRAGGFEGRHFDECFPLHFGICGDEGLGPGGLSAGWRGWSTVRNLLASVASLCPNALVLMLSSPLGILVGAAQREFPGLSVIGICELPWTTLLQFAALRGIDARDLNFDYIGLNHLGWFYRIQTGGRDLLLEYISQPNYESSWPPPKLVGACGGFPTKYLQLHYCPEQRLSEQKAQAMSRARVLEEISKDCYQAFDRADKDGIVHALERRPTPWYEHAVAPFLLSVANAGASGPYFLTGRTNAQFGCDGMWESPVFVSDGRLYLQSARGAPPAGITKIMRAFAAYEAQAISAVISRDAVELRQALALHPWVATEQVVDALAKAIMSQSATALARA